MPRYLPKKRTVIRYKINTAERNILTYRLQTGIREIKSNESTAFVRD